MHIGQRQPIGADRARENADERHRRVKLTRNIPISPRARVSPVSTARSACINAAALARTAVGFG